MRLFSGSGGWDGRPCRERSEGQGESSAEGERSEKVEREELGGRTGELGERSERREAGRARRAGDVKKGEEEPRTEGVGARCSGARSRWVGKGKRKGAGAEGVDSSSECVV